MSFKKILTSLIALSILILFGILLWKKNTLKNTNKIDSETAFNPKKLNKDIPQNKNQENNKQLNTDFGQINAENLEQNKNRTENAVARLNANTLSKAEREEYLVIYKRLIFLDKYILNLKLKVVSDALKDIEVHHEERLHQFGVNTQK